MKNMAAPIESKTVSQRTQFEQRGSLVGTFLLGILRPDLVTRIVPSPLGSPAHQVVKDLLAAERNAPKLPMGMEIMCPSIHNPAVTGPNCVPAT